MPDSADKTLGEVWRAIERLEQSTLAHQTETRARFHELVNSMTAVLGPISIHTVHIANQQSETTQVRHDLQVLAAKVEDHHDKAATLVSLNLLGVKVEAMTMKFAGVTGAIAVLAVLGQWLLTKL